MSHRPYSADIAIIGGGVGGCAAALAALEIGARVVMTEETAWIGGQLTAQAVPPDEHGWIERYGRTASYAKFREAVRTHYRQNTPLKPEFRDNPKLNAGNGWGSPLCHEPKVALAVLETLMAPHIQSGQLKILRHHAPVSCELNGMDRIAAVLVNDLQNGTVRGSTPGCLSMRLNSGISLG